MRPRLPRVGGLRLLFSLAFRSDPLRATIALVPILAIAFAAMPMSLRMVIDAIPHHDRTRIYLGAIIIAVSLVGAVSLGFFQFKQKVRLGDSIGFELDRRLIEMTTRLADITHFERAEHLDRLEMLRTQRFALRDAMSNVGWAIEGVAGALVAVGLLASVHPLLGLLPLASMPSLMVGGPAQRMIDDATQATAERSRRQLHLFDVGTLPGPAKEIRVFGQRDEITRRYRAEFATIEQVVDRAQRRSALLRVGGTMIAAAGYALALWFLVHEIRLGAVSAGDTFVALSVSARLTDQLGRSAGTFGALRHARNVAERFEWLDDYAQSTQPRADQALHHPPERLVTGITLDHVSFTYDGAPRPSLDDVTLHLPPGTVVAIVGENGAGKSTLVKLLFAMYQPTSGGLSIDGVALNDIDVDAWRRSTAACYQDFARFELLAREVVGVGDLPRLDDDAAFTRAVERAGAAGIVDGLASGSKTQLGSTFGGPDLSGGQWQKLAIARAMMRSAPLLVALDEPTSALDPLAEFEMFERYARAAADAAATSGAITVVVSHRFSTVRLADLIVVLDNGRLVEVGSHDELVVADGLYAELYELQASQYR